MILCGAGAAVALVWAGLPGAVLAAVLAQTQMLLDCSDGELARWRGDFSAAGVFLDKVGHYTAEDCCPSHSASAPTAGSGPSGGGPLWGRFSGCSSCSTSR